MGMERTPNKNQQAKLTLEKEILPPLLPGFELATFRSRVRRSNQQAIPAPLRLGRILVIKALTLPDTLGQFLHELEVLFY